jgi:multiple sugar transport system permease protein
MASVTSPLAPSTARAASSGARKRWRKLPAYVALTLLAILFTLPFAWLISTSLKDPKQIFVVPPQWIPNPFVWENYPRSTTFIPFWRYMANTLYVTIFNVIASVTSCSLVAYGFARIKWPGRNIVFLVLISTLMIPYPVTLIPTFLIFRDLGLVGTLNALTFPALFGSAFYIFLLRQFYMTIPQELSQAAKIDGASEFQIYWKIILPLAKPALAVVALFAFIANWNDFLGPLIFLNDKDNYTLAIGLYGFFGRSRTEWGLLMAAATLMIAPIILLFFLAQRTFIEGITLTGLKG